jgi:tRNA-dihydrouridine synthase B
MDFSETVIRGIEFEPARFCAPLAGITHSAFRRLVAGFGGCGALWTEMLSARQILHEDLRASPWLRRRPVEKRVIYQLMIRDTDQLDRTIGRLAEIGPDGLDINLACHAPAIRHLDAGSALFLDPSALSAALQTARRCWPGLLTVKIRLGREVEGWQAIFAERMKRFEDCGVDAVVLHPRFFEDKFKRRARHELLAWAASLSRLPLIASGDITGADAVRELGDHLKPACAVMVGRMAAAQPWVFAAWDEPLPVNHAEVWHRLFDYTCEDFPPEKAMSRMKVFTKYYARNFKFGHDFATAVQNAPDLAALRRRAGAFFARSPVVDPEPTLSGL